MTFTSAAPRAAAEGGGGGGAGAGGAGAGGGRRPGRRAGDAGARRRRSHRTGRGSGSGTPVSTGAGSLPGNDGSGGAAGPPTGSVGGGDGLSGSAAGSRRSVLEDDLGRHVRRLLLLDDPLHEQLVDGGLLRQRHDDVERADAARGIRHLFVDPHAAHPGRPLEGLAQALGGPAKARQVRGGRDDLAQPPDARIEASGRVIEPPREIDPLRQERHEAVGCALRVEVVGQLREHLLDRVLQLRHDLEQRRDRRARHDRALVHLRQEPGDPFSLHRRSRFSLHRRTGP